MNYLKKTCPRRFSSKDDQLVNLENGLRQQAPVEIERQENPKYLFATDLLLFSLMVIFWTLIIRFFVCLMIHLPKSTSSIVEFLFLILCLLILSFSFFQFETVMKNFQEDTTPVKRSKKPYILRLRVFGQKEFIETEISADELSYENVLKLCCNELGLLKDQVKRLWKIPETLIRNDLDVKRFRHLEYLEVHIY